MEAGKIETVPCNECGKPLDTKSLKDGTTMILLDGSKINICHRCAAIKNGFSIDNVDAVWGKSE